MKHLDLFYRNPRLTVLLLGIILIAGLSSLNTLPRQEDPTLIARFAGVTTSFPGASAERVESLVAEPLENALREIPEVKTIRSTSRTGLSLIFIELDDSVTDVDEVWSRARDQLNDAQPELPSGAGVPDFERGNVAAHTLLIGFSWNLPGTPQLGMLHRFAQDLEQQLASQPGTRETELFGEPEEQIRVTINPSELITTGLSAADVATALRLADVKLPAGELHASGSNLLLEIGGELDSISRVRSVPVINHSTGQQLRVGDIATVEQVAVEPAETVALIHGQQGIVVGAVMADGERVDSWAQSALARFDVFNKTLPKGIKAEILFDQSLYTSDRLSSLTQNLLLGAGIVLLILFFMMGWRSAILVGAALPLSLAMVTAGLSLLDVALHQISITGLIIALGLLIDNAIVSVESYNKGRQGGLPPAQAIVETLRHLSIPLGASTLTTALTFMPIVLMPGGTGEFVGSIGVAVILSIVSSLFLSMTLIPALAAFLDKGAASSGSHFWQHGLQLPKLTSHYRRFLNQLVHRPALGICLALIMPLAGFVLASQLTQQFFPPVDRAQFQLQIKLPAHVSLAEAQKRVLKVREILATYPEVTSSHWFLGENPPKVYYNTQTDADGLPGFAGGFVNTTSAEATATLLPTLQRQLMDAMPDAVVLSLPFEQGPPVEAPIEVRIIGHDLEILRQLGDQVRLLLGQSKHVTYTQAKLNGGRPKLAIAADEDAVQLAGLTLSELANTLHSRLEGIKGGTVLQGSEQLPVIVRLGGDIRTAVAPMMSAPLMVKDGSSMPLNAIAKVTLEPESDTIRRRDGVRINNILAYIEPFQLPGETLADFKQKLANNPVPLPAGYRLEYGGESQQRDESQSGMIAVMGPLIVMMIGTIVLAFNSFRMSLVIGLVAFQSMGLALLSLWLFGYPMGFMAIIGSMGLIGLAINDSIVILAALRDDAKASRGDRDAIVQVVVKGTRHIVSTTLTTVGGFLPLILWGGAFWPPLAVTIAGGLVGATLLALCFVPAAYALVTRGRDKELPQPRPELTTLRSSPVS